MLQLLAYTLFQRSPGGHLQTQISGPYPQSLWSFGSGVRLVSLHLSCVPRWCFCCRSRDHTWGTTALSGLLKTERSNTVGILLGSVKIHKLFSHYVPGMMQAITDSGPHLIGMAPAPPRSWARSIMTTISEGARYYHHPCFTHEGNEGQSQCSVVLTQLTIVSPPGPFTPQTTVFPCVFCLCTSQMWLLYF